MSAVSSRVIPRPRISKAMAQEASRDAARITKLAASADTPVTVGRIPTRAGAIMHDHDAKKTKHPTKFVISPMGNARRVFLVDPPYFGQAEDMEGMAHRLSSLTKSEAIHSILIATDDQDDSLPQNVMPRYLSQRNVQDESVLQALAESSTSWGVPNTNNNESSTWYVAGSYDALDLATQLEQARNNHDNDNDKSPADLADYWMTSLSHLASASRGDEASPQNRCPVITVPHGMITDGGYALCMGGFVVATPETAFSIQNPSKGLSLDPIGLSFLLNRLGWQDRQEPASSLGCLGLMLALTGYTANAYDMVETGLATHYVSEIGEALPLLEEALASLDPYAQQGLVKGPRQFYNQANHHSNKQDYNRAFRNVPLAHLLEQLADHSSNDSLGFLDYTAATTYSDPALDTDVIPWEEGGFHTSPLLHIATQLNPIFQRSSSLEALMEGLKEHSSHARRASQDDPAGDLVKRMEASSPLALRVVFQLMTMGSKENATMKACMEREQTAQTNLLLSKDFRSWAQHQHKNPQQPFGGWQHDSVAAVTSEEVHEMLS